MAAWVMILGMVTLINVTMVGAVMQLAGNIPDPSLLVILSRYLRKKEEKEEPRELLLHHLEASARLQRLRRRSALLAVLLALAACGLTIGALVVGWGAWGMAAVTVTVRKRAHALFVPAGKGGFSVTATARCYLDPYGYLRMESGKR